MKPLLEITATEARKNIYKLIDQVSSGEVRVIIHNTDTDKKVMLMHIDQEESKKEIEQDLKTVAETVGSIKTSGYNKREFEMAQKAYVKQYLKKNGT